jgi:hypothetical protein
VARGEGIEGKETKKFVRSRENLELLASFLFLQKLLEELVIVLAIVAVDESDF